MSIFFFLKKAGYIIRKKSKNPKQEVWLRRERLKLERQRSTEKPTNRTETLQIHYKNYKSWQIYLVQKSHKSLYYETCGVVSYYPQDFHPAEGSLVGSAFSLSSWRVSELSPSIVRPSLCSQESLLLLQYWSKRTHSVSFVILWAL